MKPLEKERRYKSCWKYFNPPPRLYYATLTDYIPKTKEQKRAKEYCETYSIGDIRAGKGIIMQGLYGSGKTHLAIATINNLMESDITSFGCTAYKIEEVSLYDHESNDYPGIHCSFFNVVDLLNRIKPKDSYYSKHYGDWLLRRAKYDGLVILDDVGAERATEWVEETLYGIINTRYEKELATIFTSNCSDEQLRDKLGGRILSRIFGMTEKVIVTGPDGRRG
jgi:DNA replication protein DnaC